MRACSAVGGGEMEESSAWPAARICLSSKEEEAEEEKVEVVVDVACG